MKSQETEARLLALESQMNPHFLYNNITNISIMAEEGMNEQIVAFCGNIASMLRYISTPRKNGVPLSQELDYCERYRSERLGLRMIYTTSFIFRKRCSLSRFRC